MSPEGAIKVRLSKLIFEIERDLGALRSRVFDVQDLTGRTEPLDRPELAFLAVNVHAWYTGLETLFERVARQFDGTVPSGQHWHAELCLQMATTVSGLRDALVQESAIASLAELRRFRHFFRNAYVLDLDASKVGAQARLLLSIHPQLAQSIELFLAQLRQTIQG